MTDQAGKGRGCFFYGCLTVVVLSLVAAVGLYLGFRYMVNKVVNEYTETTPLKLPKTEMAATEATALNDRVTAFNKALEAGTAKEPLVLDEREMNVLIGVAPQLAQFKDRVHLSIVGDQLKGQVSLPVETLGFPRFAGRYLNGSAAIKPSLENGVLIVTLQELEVKGIKVPEQFMAGVRQQNLAKDVYKDAKTAETMRKIEKVEIKDGRLTIQPSAGK